LHRGEGGRRARAAGHRCFATATGWRS
jgi:hypothetical protein